MFEGLQDELDRIEEALEGERREAEIVRVLGEEIESSSPDSIRMQTLKELLESPDAMEVAIKMIADDQLWEQNVNRYGELMPPYKPSTIAKKRKLGFPEDKLVNYTYYMTGRFRSDGINVEVDLVNDFYDFEKTDRLPYFKYLDDNAVGMTEENEARFKKIIGSWLNDELDRWMMEQLREHNIDPKKYGYF